MSNYIINKLNYKLSQLLNKLQTFELINKESRSNASANVGSSSGAKPTKKKSYTRPKTGPSHSSKGKSYVIQERNPNKRSRTRSLIRLAMVKTLVARENIFTVMKKAIRREIAQNTL